MTELVDIRLDLDAQGYVQTAGQVAAATAQMVQGQAQVQSGAGAVERSLRMMLPRPMVASFVAFTAVAAASESRLAGMQATAKVTSQNMGSLGRTMNELARSFPVGNRGAQQIVQSIQQAGVSASGQEGRIRGLSKAVTELGAATGTDAPAIGRQMIQLSRAFGNTELDPSRFSKMSDSLTTLSAKSGASAESILSFSSQIAPLARSTGLGQTAVMGISTAFTKMGEDGFAASNAMNKMLSDLNRSVRDGTSEMGAYANIVGTTRGEFEALFKQDPAEALARITEAIGQAGPGAGQRMLENIGIEGVRGQRAFAALTQAGGVREAVGQATAAYGTGSTRQAAEQAMSGLQDSFTKLGASSEQIAVALGSPLLKAVTGFTDVIGFATSAIAKVMSSAPVQTLMKIGGAIGGTVGIFGMAAAAGFAARRLTTTVAPFVQGAWNNAPIQAMRAAAAQAQGRTLSPVQQRLLARVDTGTVAGSIGGLTTRMARIGTAYGEERTRIRQEAAAARQSTATPRGGFVRGLFAYGREANRGYTNVLMDAQRQLASEVGTRRSGLAPGRDDMGRDTGQRGMYGRLADNLREAGTAGQTLGQRLSTVSSAFRTTHREIVAQGSAVRSLNVATRDTVRSMRQSSALLMSTAAKGTMAVGGAVMGSRIGQMLTLGMGAPGLALIAGAVGYSAVRNAQQTTRERRAEDESKSITSTSDKYLEAMGKAADATISFAQQAQNMAQALAKTQKDIPTSVSSAEREAARSGSIVQNYAGSARSVIEQINAQFGGRITDEQMSALTIDLMREGQNRGQGFRQSEVEQILRGLRRENERAAFAPTGGTGIDYGELFSDAGQSQAGTGAFHRMWRAIGGMEGSTGGGSSDVAGNILKFISPISWGSHAARRLGAEEWGGVGTFLNPLATTKEQETAVEAGRQAIAQREGRQQASYGPEYARQEAMREANRQVAAAMAEGDEDLIARITEALSKQLGARAQTVSPEDITRAGGFVQALQRQDEEFDQEIYELRRQNPRFSYTGEGMKPTAKDSPLTTLLDDLDVFGRAVSNRAADIDSAMNKAYKAFEDTPNTKNLRIAVDEFIKEAERSGKSLGDISKESVGVLNRLSTASAPGFQQAAAVLERTQMGIAASTRRIGTGAALGLSITNAADRMQIDPNIENGAELSEQARADLQELHDRAWDTAAERLMAEMNYYRQSRRQREAFELQQGYAEEDYERSRARSQEDYNIQRERQIAAYYRNVARAQEDYQRQRARAQRDFNKQLVRMNEDAAKAMYDPYKRIQVQAVYDMGTLMVNLREQNRAMQQQAANLNRLRQLGVNNDVIDQLRLNQSENAQQLARLVADISTGGADAATRLNETIATRMGAAATLNMDQSNKELARSREDFNTSMADQEEDFTLSLARQQEDFMRSLNEMAADFQRAMDRAGDDQRRAMDRMNEAFRISMQHAAEDHAWAQKTITGSYEQVQVAMQEAMTGNISEGTKLMKNTAVTAATEVKKAVDALSPELRRMFLQEGVIQLIVSKTELVNRNTGENYTQAQQQLDQFLQDQYQGNRTANKNLFPGDGEGELPPPGGPVRGWQQMYGVVKQAFPGTKLISGFRPGAITATGNPSYHGMGRAVDLPPDMNLFNWIRASYPNSRELIFSPAGNRQVHNGRPHVYTGVTKSMHYDHVHWAMQAGGIVNQPTKVLVGEARDSEAIVPLNQGGVNMLADAFRRYLDSDSILGMDTSSRRTHIVYQSSVNNYDQRTEVTGPITIKSNDPNDMARQLAAKARRDNLGQTPTRRS